jgi:type I restriction enzyme, R subunit
LELIHDFVVFDKGIKKLCRPNQYFAIKASQENIATRTGGIFGTRKVRGKALPWFGSPNGFEKMCETVEF